MRIASPVLAAMLVGTSCVSAASDCLTDKQATSIVNQFAFLLENSNSSAFAPAAKKLLTKDFFDQSDSVNFLAGLPLGSITFPNRTSFIEIAGSQPPFPSIETLDTFHSCNSIAWRFNATGFPPPSLEIVGITLFTVNAPSTGKVNSIRAELNSAAFEANLGFPECNNTNTSS